jgi:hypothetical protein
MNIGYLTHIEVVIHPKQALSFGGSPIALRQDERHGVAV